MLVTRFALPLIMLAAVVAPAAAACREDLVTVSQTVERTRAGLQGAAAGSAKCAAYRDHIAALGQVRDVFARCDKGDSKGKNAAQVKATIADLTRQMRASCKG